MWKIARTPKKSGEVISPTLTIEVMGYSIPIDLTVLPEKTLGTYNPITRRVTIDPFKNTDDYGLAYTVAHECHHWLIHNGNRTILPKDRRQIRLQNLLILSTLAVTVTALHSIIVACFGVSLWYVLPVNIIVSWLVPRILLSSKIAYRHSLEEHTANKYAEQFAQEFVPTARRIRLMWRLKETTHPSES